MIYIDWNQLDRYKYEGVTYARYGQYEYSYVYFKVAPIEWRAFKEDGNKLYLVSNQLYEKHIFNNSDCKYDASELRTWVTNDFFNKAFKDKSLLLNVFGNDKITIPTNGDIIQMWDIGIPTSISYTDYAKHIAGYFSDYNGSYWVNKTNDTNNYPYYVYTGTDCIVTNGQNNIGVRFVICIDLNKI